MFTTVRATVVDQRMLTPELVKVTLSGVDHPVLGGDEYHYVMVPQHGEDVGTLSPETASLGAYYTARARRPENQEIDLWIVLNPASKGVARWAANAEVGDQVGIWGSCETFHPPDGTSKVLIVCDSSGYAAAASILDGLPRTHDALVLAEVIDLDHQPPLPDRPGVEIRWVERQPLPAGKSGVLPDAVEALSIDTQGLYVFGAGESREMTRIRRHVRETLGLSQEQESVLGYWRAEP